MAGLADDKISDGEGLLVGAAVGAATGAGSGALKTRHARKSIVIECMRGRGHKIVR